MSTATDRKAAKTAIVETQEDDPELNARLAHAANQQLALTREQHRHREAMNCQNLGFIGRWLGNGSNSQTNAALVAILFGGLLTIGFYVAAFTRPETSEIWSRNAERALAFTAAALAFVFGKGQKQACLRNARAIPR